MDVLSVGDASHVLTDVDGQPRAERPSSEEAGKLMRYIDSMAGDYPPRWVIDLHEDNMIDAGYVYSQGSLGVDDPLAQLAVQVLQEQGVPIQQDGETRFGEAIVNGVVGPVRDGSVDEYLDAIADGTAGNGLGTVPTNTVLVIETPVSLQLSQRVNAHREVIKQLTATLEAMPVQ